MKPIVAHFNASERGAALLSALLLIAVLSGVVVAVLDDIRFAIRRTANLKLHDQAYWFAQGAENLGRQTIWRSWKSSPNRTTLNDPWARSGVRFPIDGGSISGRITDGGNCFNLNSVVEQDLRGRWQVRDLGRRQFERLLMALDMNSSEAESLSAAVADWIDTDSAVSPGGAEDGDYMRLNPPYRTGATLLADVTELRAIRGFTEKVYQAARPFVCALPSNDLSRINVNTLRPEQAALIVMLAGDGLSISAARRAIEARPAAGYAEENAFWQQDGLIAFKPTDDLPRQTAVTTSFYLLETRVQFYEADVTTMALMELSQNGDVMLRARRLGEME